MGSCPSPLPILCTLLLGAGTLSVPAQLPTARTPAPGDLLGFSRWAVQDRAAGGLNRIVRKKTSPKYGTVYGGTAEDANIAWVAATAYANEWSRFHRNPALRETAFFLVDRLAEIHADGDWDDGGLGAYFGLHGFAWAVLSWLETGDVDPARAAKWRAAVQATAESAMRCMSRGICAGQYANPEFYYLSGLAAAAKICSREDYREEAARALRRYENVLFPGGGVAYFHQTAPQHGYQQMIVKSVALYWLLARDPYGLRWLRRLAPYFVNVQHRSGLLTDAEHPWLKHRFYNPLNPAVPGMLACILQDGKNRTVAESAARLRADNANGKLPSFLEKNPNWYNYSQTTFAAAFLRILREFPLPESEAIEQRRILRDGSFRGIRSHWDAFTAAVTTRQASDTLAGAYLANPEEPMMPLDSGLDGVFAEILRGDRSAAAPAHVRKRSRYGCVEWTPWTHFTATENVQCVSLRSRLCSPYWNDLPWIPGERWALNEISDWTQIQHWAVWRDHLVGFCVLRCHADGGAEKTDDAARIRWRLTPRNRVLTEETDDADERQLTYGGLRLTARLLEEKGGFAFVYTEDEAAPRAAHSLVLSRAAPWRTGDFVVGATDCRPAASDTRVRLRLLKEAAAAVLATPGKQRAYIWIVSLGRHMRQHHLDLPAGVRARVFERDVELTPPAPGEPATVSLHGGESGIIELTGNRIPDPDTLLAGLRSGWGRGEKRR